MRSSVGFFVRDWRPSKNDFRCVSVTNPRGLSDKSTQWDSLWYLIPNPKQVVANEALRLKGTLCDAYTQRRESYYSAVCVCDLRVKFLFLSHPCCSLFLSGVAHVWGQKVSRLLHLVVKWTLLYFTESLLIHFCLVKWRLLHCMARSQK